MKRFFEERVFECSMAEREREGGADGGKRRIETGRLDSVKRDIHDYT